MKTIDLCLESLRGKVTEIYELGYEDGVKGEKVTDEAREAILKRQVASQKWAEDLIREKKPSKMTKALMVFVLTHDTTNWLAENDPQALRQAQEALNGKSYIDYLERPRR